jgi:hypothetical protein
MVELQLHSLIHLHGIVLNKLSTGTTLLFVLLSVRFLGLRGGDYEDYRLLGSGAI